MHWRHSYTQQGDGLADSEAVLAENAGEVLRIVEEILWQDIER